VTKPPLQAPRGTRDFYPEDLRLRAWLFAHFREVSRQFGFEEIDTPILEHAELFTRKAGEEIVGQLYHFELHGRRLALRPEMTPSIARMVIARAGSLSLPLRWFAITQNWRYERATRGRKREHYQWNMDIWGEPGVAAEAELIATIFALLERLGLQKGEVRIRLNSRSLLEETLRQGVLRRRPEAFAPLCIVIDKLSKLGTDTVEQQLCDPQGPVALEREEAREVIALLGVKDLEQAAAAHPRASRPLAELRRLLELLDAYGVAEWIDFDASVVRGLAYYTGIVFEAFDALGKLRAVCGGGRYDHLLEALGGPAIPAVGFGFGDVVVTELLAERGTLPSLRRELDDVVFPFSEAERPAAIRLARRLRSEGRAVELVLGRSRPRRVLADADRAGAQRVFLLGPDEFARGVVRVKDLHTQEERDEQLA
jgi:histidyl-tRNA synthetase